MYLQSLIYDQAHFHCQKGWILDRLDVILYSASKDISTISWVAIRVFTANIN